MWAASLPAFQAAASQGFSQFRDYARGPRARVGVKSSKALGLKFYKKKKGGVAVRPALKYTDYPQASQCPAVGGDVYTLGVPQEGTEYNNRVGRVVFNKYIQVTLTFSPPSTSTNIDYATVHLVYDHTPGGIAPTVAQILDLSTITTPFNAYRNLQTFTDRFKIVKSWHSSVIGSDYGILPQCRMFYKVPSLQSKSTFAASTGLPETGGFFVLIISKANTAAAASSFAYVLSARVAFNSF